MKTRHLILAYAVMFLIVVTSEWIGWVNAGHSFGQLLTDWAVSGEITLVVAAIYLGVRKP